MARGNHTDEMVEFLAKERAARSPHKLVGVERIEQLAKGADQDAAVGILQQGLKRTSSKLDEIELRGYWHNLHEREARAVEESVAKFYR